jgi:hypothetical protein
MSHDAGKGAEPPARDDGAEALAEDIEKIRGRLGGMVGDQASRIPFPMSRATLSKTESRGFSLPIPIRDGRLIPRT